MKHNLAIPSVLLAALFWGTTGTSQSFAPEGTSPLAFGAVRLAVGGLFLLIFSAATGRLKLKGLPLPAVLISSAGMALYQPLFFSGVTLSGIAAGTVAALGSAPVIAGLLEWMLTSRKPPVKWWIATAGAVSGCLLLSAGKPSQGFQPAGMLLSVGAGAAFAIYALFSKKLLERHSPETAAAVVFSLSALWLSPLLFFTDLSWLITGRGAAVSLYIGIIATGIAYLLFNYGLSRLQASATVTFSLAEPLAAAMLGILALGEHISGWGMAGLLLMLGALLLLASK